MYSSAFLRNFRKVMHDCNNYQAFSLDIAIRSWILALGAQKRHTQVPYRQSRAGQRLFHHIATIQSQNATDGTRGQQELNQVNYNNLIGITVSNNRNLYLKVSHINAHSIYHKIQPFQEHILAKDVSLCAICETWLPSDNEDLQYKEIPPSGYSIFSEPCNDGRCGSGLSLVYKDHLQLKGKPLHMTKLMELMNFNIAVKGININICYL